MTVYLLTILFLFVFSLLEDNYNLSLDVKKWMIVISYLILVFQVGLRWETGTDWNSYFEHFDSFIGFQSILLSNFEYGYGIFEWIIKSFSSNYSVFLLIHASIYYFLIFSSFRRYTPNLYMSLMLFYTLSMGMLGSNRQLIALAICIYAIRFVIEKKAVVFFLFILIATSFHSTAFLFVIYYFINKNIKPLEFVLILLGAVLIGKTNLSLIMFSKLGDILGGYVLDKTTVYTDNAKEYLAETSLSAIGLAKRCIFLLFFYSNRKYLREKIKYYNLMLNGYFFGIVMYFLFSNTLLVMVSRGSLYFNIMEPLLLVSQLSLLKGKDIKSFSSVVFLIFSIFFLYQSIAAYPDLFDPYKGVFVNTDFYREMR